MLLERAAQKGNATAYYVLAQTFDIAALKQWPAAEARGEPKRAKALYRRALERGVEEARAALAALEGD
jgi:TPR repeat protein